MRWLRPHAMANDGAPTPRTSPAQHEAPSGGQQPPPPCTSLYALLGCERTATTVEIKLAFRLLARRLHPDVNKGAGAQLKFEVGCPAPIPAGDTVWKAVYVPKARSLRQSSPWNIRNAFAIRVMLEACCLSLP